MNATFARLILLPLALALATPTFAQQNTAKSQATLKVYGPGGPAPAMKEAAKIFGEKKKVNVIVEAGPTAKWKEQALSDADVIYSGAEYMMTDFTQKDLSGLIDTATIQTLYLRPSAILVRPGNPKKIIGVKDLAKPGLKLLVVQGAGQTGMWEDVAGRSGSVKLVDAIRRNIGNVSANSADAKKLWTEDTSYDAWLIWTIWQKENPAAADLVATEPDHTVYRSTGVAITARSTRKALAKDFTEFLKSNEGRAIFTKFGWIEPK